MRRIFSDKKRITALFLAAVMCFALFSAICIIGAEADHDCSGEDCTICLQISVCNSILRSLGLLLLMIHGAFTVLLFRKSLIRYLCTGTGHHTLVSLNVKISN